MNTQSAPKRTLGLEQGDFYMLKQLGIHSICLFLLLNYEVIVRLCLPNQMPKAIGVAMFVTLLAMAIFSFVPLAMNSVRFYIHQIVTLFGVLITGLLVILHLDNSTTRYTLAIFSFESAVFFIVSFFYLRHITRKLKA